MPTENFLPLAAFSPDMEERLHSQCNHADINSTLVNHRVSIVSYLQKIAYQELLTQTEEENLVKRIQQNDSDAWYLLLETHLRLVLRIARSYQNSTQISLSDLFETGNLALIAAARQYVTTCNERFAIYATRCICEHLEASILLRDAALT